MTDMGGGCRDVDENMSDILEGVAPGALFEHVAGCERCRDARYDAEQIILRVGDASADYRVPEGLEARLMAVLDAREERETQPAKRREGRDAGATRGEATLGGGAIGNAPTSAQVAELLPAQRSSQRLAPSAEGARALPSKRWTWLSLAAAVLLGVIWIGSRPEASSESGAGIVRGAWQGQVLQVQRAFGSPAGLSQCTPGTGECEELLVGEVIHPGMRLETDGLTRALVKLDDGSVVALDRATRLELSPTEQRRGRLLTGNLIAEIEKPADEDPAGQPANAGAPSHAVFDIPAGRAEVLGTKLALRATADTGRVEVSRGTVKLVDSEGRAISVQAGEAGQIASSVAPEVEAVLDLGQAFGWSAAAFEEKHAEQAQGALGELTAKRPQDTDEKSGAVRLTEHHVKVRIVDNIARTEVEEVFTNQTDDVLEGIYRFPLPPGAQIERLALEVDGKLEEGAFIERERAAAIWRGAVVNAGGKKPPAADEIIWVPGPWKDPALLEWQRGNRFELRIFPIAKRASRRIVLAYTQVLPPTDGGRLYVYPLPQDPRGTTRIDRFTAELEVRGHDLGQGVRARGYPLKALSGAPEVARLGFEAQNFSPMGDLGLAYQVEGSHAELRAWAYQPAGADLTAPTSRQAPGSAAHVSSERWSGVPADAPYVAIALRPTLPRRAEHEPRDYVLVADTSRSMIGESYRRAVSVVERVIQEMDRRDRVTVLGCDSACQSLPGGFRTPGEASAEAAAGFLSSIEPEGASDLTFAIREAFAAGDGGRSLRVVYVGDGTPTVGPIHPALIRRAIAGALPRGGSLNAVAVGSDADRAALRVATQAGGGVTVAFTPGQSARDVAYAVLGATYGHALEQARLELPEGMVAVMPRELGSIAAGAEEIIVARLTSPRVQGEAVLRGQVAGEGFEQRYPIEVVATTSQGNAFVPRLYAAVAIANLEASMDDAARRESIELSLRFNVASRYTSLLVLESPAMFKAFGLDNRRRAPEWSGDRESEKSETANETPADADVGATSGGLGAPRAAMKASSSKDELRAKERNQSLDGDDGAVDFSEPKKAGRAAPGSAPAPSRAESAANDWAFDRERLEPEPPPSPVLELPPVRQRRMIPMRRVWDRIGSIDSPPRLLDATSPARRATLESLEREQEQSRQALKGLYVDAFLAGELERAAGFADRWSTKDPLDVDALTARADLAAQRGQRDLAIRILGSVVDVRPGDYKAQWRLARLHRWAGRAERGCRHSLAVAQLMLRDPKLVAEAVSCARDVGQSTWVNDLLDALSPDVRDAVKRLDTIRTAGNELSGDFRARAEWGGAEHDLDLVILHPDGYRVSWLGAPTQAVITATDVNSMHREGLALRGTAAGQYAVELVRSSPTSGVVRGSLELYVGNQRRTIPFLLEGDRVRVATAKLRLQSRLVPY